jgi:anti-anti-sigma factor
LLWLLDEVSERNGQVRLVKTDDTVRKILQLTRLDRRFNVHDSIESAAKSLR